MYEQRRRFREGDCLNRAASGEFGCCLKSASRSRSVDQPSETRSLMVSYVDDSGNRVFLDHLYLRPDGSIGASGLPGPKWLYEDGVDYQLAE
jgi:hypothetical protein